MAFRITRFAYPLALLLVAIGFLGYWHQTWTPVFTNARNQLMPQEGWSEGSEDLELSVQEKDPLPEYCDYCGPRDTTCRRYG